MSDIISPLKVFNLLPDKKLTKKNMSYFQAKRKYNLSPTGDADRDGVRNFLDCKPLNPNKQGIIHAITGFNTENKARLILKDAKKLLELAVVEYQKGNAELAEHLEQQGQELAKQAQQIFESGKTEIDTEKNRIITNVKKGLQVKKQKRVKTYTPPFFIARKQPMQRLYAPTWVNQNKQQQRPQPFDIRASSSSTRPMFYRLII